MSVSKIASRYAKPLLELAIEQNILDQVAGDMEGFGKAMEQRDFKLMMDSPIITTSKKIAVLEQLFKGKMNSATYQFLELILKKGRENMIGEIHDEFTKQYQKYKGISEVTLISAHELNESELASIRQKLEGSNETRDTVIINKEIDPSLIGGFVLKIGDKRYDASVKHKLEKLKKSLKAQ